MTFLLFNQVWWYIALWDKEFPNGKLYLSKLVFDSAESNTGNFRGWKGHYFIDVVYENPFQELKLSAVIIIFSEVVVRFPLVLSP